jgi:hypothetical protein
MFPLLAMLACFHPVSTWEEVPPPAVALPDGKSVAIVAETRSCKAIADTMVRLFAEREDVRVEPDATPALRVRDCSHRVDVDIDIDFSFGSLDYGIDGQVERRRVTLVGTGRAEVIVDQGNHTGTVLVATARERSGTTWYEGDDSTLHMRLKMQQNLTDDVAFQLTQKIAPIPEVVRRRVYRDPADGSAEDLVNQAVEAERAGDLERALELAKQASLIAGGQSARGYVQTLEDKLDAHDG